MSPKAYTYVAGATSGFALAAFIYGDVRTGILCAIAALIGLVRM